MEVGNISEMTSQSLEGEEPKEAKGSDEDAANDFRQQQSSAGSTVYKWWAEMTVYSLFVLSSQTVGTLLGRLYFMKGGKSKWMATLVQAVGFPVLIPFLFFSSSADDTQVRTITSNPSPRILVPLYIFLGLFGAGNCMLYSVGLMYLPVTTYSLVSASQLGFNALFSFFLNAQKFTALIINSVVLLTLSSAILVLQPDDSGEDGPANPSRRKYAIGFLSTLAASAGFGLQMSLMQLAFQRIFKRETFRLVIEMSLYQEVVAFLAILAGLFASGEWRGLSKEMNEFELGRVSYVMNLAWTAVGWQVFTVGTVGLIFKVSSLFSNVIGILALPIPPVLAVFIFKDKMSGIKVISLLLALWGFVSYIYQQYLDDLKAKNDQREQNIQASETALIQRV